MVVSGVVMAAVVMVIVPLVFVMTVMGTVVVVVVPLVFVVMAVAGFRSAG